MNYTLLALAGVIGALVVISLYLIKARRPQQTPKKIPKKTIQLSPTAQLDKLKETESFWGVTVESRCSESSSLAGVSFPFQTAPRLPVQGCPEVVCRCSFIGLPERRQLRDRRSGQDRRGLIRVDSVDRRSRRPRREADLISWQAYRQV